MGYRRKKRAQYPGSRAVAELESEVMQLRKALNEARLERDILKKATVDSIGQRNSYVKHGVAEVF
ncbi:transposase family [Shigella dysenteriae]|nr:transposase family [Shigella dysenteriae]